MLAGKEESYIGIKLDFNTRLKKNYPNWKKKNTQIKKSNKTTDNKPTSNYKYGKQHWRLSYNSTVEYIL